MKKTQPNIFKRFIKWTERQFRIDRFRFITFCCLISIIFIGMTSEYLEYSKEHQEYLSIAKLREGTLQEFQTALNDNKISEISKHTLNNGSMMTPSSIGLLEVKQKDGTAFTITAFAFSNETVGKAMYENALKNNIIVKKGFEHGSKNRFMEFLFFILHISALIVILLIVQRAASDILVGKNFNTKSADPDISFDDIVGYEEVKREMREVIQQLISYKKISSNGIKPPKGILFTGSPGVGKTMFAKAMANEFDAKFLYATGSDFVEMYVGVGARRVRSIFNEARHNSPTIIFIDEIDALGARDSYGMDSERLSTINQMLAEMDGMNENKAVLVIGATNHPDKLDAALLRPGRFDKKIMIPNPDLSTREAILKKYIGENALHTDVDLHNIALRTPNSSGAELKNLVEEAKTLASRRCKDEELVLTRHDFEEAQEIILLGHSIREPSEKEREIVAYHELGHALIAHLKCPHLFVSKVVVGGRGSALGFTIQLPVEEKMLYSKNEMLGQISALLGGRAAEEIFIKDISNGAADDLMKSTGLAQRMVCEFGMSDELSVIKVSPTSPNPPKEAQTRIDAILMAQMEEAKRILNLNKEWMEIKKTLLLERGVLWEEDLFDSEIKIES